MQITYFRSSSYNCWSICPQQYFITYILGIPSPSGKRAIMGTVFHKVMEGLANTKLAIQNGKDSFQDDVFGEVKANERKLQDPLFVEFLFEKSFAYYASPAKTDHKFYPGDKRDIWMWCGDTLDYFNGMFDPRKRDIVAAEPHFDLPIEKDWAKYDYAMPSGERLVGHLRVKGTIDLVTKIDDNHYEVVDWKGLPLDTPLPTPDGWTTMGEISVGDNVFDRHGIPCNVIGKSAITQKQCYKIMFDDKSEVVCDEDHLWKLNNGQVINVKKLKINDEIPIATPFIVDNTARKITQIEKGIIQTTQCIMVDSPDNTYLCTQYMIPTHNTGECKDWGTGKEKDYVSFCSDPQLRMYYYALKQLHPHIDTLTMTINYVRTAGPFTLAYSEEDIEATLNMLKKRFEQIKTCVRPKLKSAQRKHWFCQRVCWYGKTPHPKDGTKSICEYIADKTKQCGMTDVIQEETNKGHSIDYYHDPGT